ncbi:hypothetical protein ACOL3H_07045 [Aliarcobacter butzleri]
MNSQELAEKLKMSNLTPSSYKPTPNIKSYEHLVITVNGKLLMGIGASKDTDSIKEANELLNCSDFRNIIAVQYPDAILDIATIHGSKINWNRIEQSISKSEVGVVEQGGYLNGNLQWIVYGDNALSISTALCINKNIQNIAR